MNKSISIGLAVCLMVLGGVALFVASKINGFPDVSASPEQGFGQLCRFELPDTISDVECHGDFWMDHSVAIRFVATKSDIERILESDFTKTKWGAVRAKFSAPPYFDDFEGRWTPAKIEDKACYSRDSSSADYHNESFLVIDRGSGLVYGIDEGTVR